MPGTDLTACTSPRLVPNVCPFAGACVTDEAPDQAVVVRMGRRSQAFIQARVKLVLAGPRAREIRDGNPEAFESRCRNQHQQRAVTQARLRQIGDPLGDQFFARQRGPRIPATHAP